MTIEVISTNVEFLSGNELVDIIFIMASIGLVPCAFITHLPSTLGEYAEIYFNAKV